MVERIVRFDVALLTITCWEIGIVLWLLPLGVYGGRQKQRLGRFLSPLMVLLGLSIVFLPPGINPMPIEKAWGVAILTPLWLGVTVYQTVVMVRTWRQHYRRRQDVL